MKYRTLHSYNLVWAVCHLFSQQRWWMHTNNQSQETIGQENYVTCVKLRPRKFRPAFLELIPRHVFSINTSSSNTLSLFYPISIAVATRSVQCDSISPTNVKKQQHGWASQAFIPLKYFNSETPTVSNHRKKQTFQNMTSVWIGHFQ